MESNKNSVIKFGGSSLSSANEIKRVAEIIKSQPNARIIVVSAPGKNDENSRKITDELLLAHLNPDEFIERTNYVKNRFKSIINELNITFDLESEWSRIIRHYNMFPNKSYLISRGEYLCAKILSVYLDIPFVDASTLIIFNHKGKVLNITYKNIKKALLEHRKFIMPGFYGAGLFGKIKVMSRGGSDISGSIAAKAIGAKKYLNYTDVDGVYSISPEISNNYKQIKTISYSDLSFLSFYGASVFHYKCERFSDNFETRILNTFNHFTKGTKVVSKSLVRNNSLTFTYANMIEYTDPKFEKLIKKSKCEIMLKYESSQSKFMIIKSNVGYVENKKLQKAYNLSKKTCNVVIYAILGKVFKMIQYVKDEHKNLIICSNNKNQTLLVYKL